VGRRERRPIPGFVQTAPCHSREPRGHPGSARLLAVAGLENVWICAQDLQLIRADRIISLLVPIAAGYGAASPDDQTPHQAVCAEIEGGTGSERLTRVKLADCGTSPAGHLLADLAAALGLAAAATPDEGCVFVFVRGGRTARHRPAVPWPSRDHRLPRPREHGRRAAGRRQPRVTRPIPAAGCVLGWSCPFLGAKWEPRSAVGCGQKLSDAVTVAV